jgi:hypothetical protein
MAKKKRTPQRSSSSVASKPVLPTVETSRPQAAVAEFNPDYTPIKHDLRRIGILAGSFFVIMVVLAILQPLILR